MALFIGVAFVACFIIPVVILIAFLFYDFVAHAWDTIRSKRAKRLSCPKLGDGLDLRDGIPYTIVSDKEHAGYHTYLAAHCDGMRMTFKLVETDGLKLLSITTLEKREKKIWEIADENEVQH